MAIGLFAHAIAPTLLSAESYTVGQVGWISSVIYLVGLAVVATFGGRTRALMVRSYCAYSVIVAVALIAATWNAARFGVTRPIWLIDRHAPRDDFNLWEYYIYPSIGKRGLDLYPGQSNAPLHWFANVKLQELIVAMTGAAAPLAGLSLNGIVGSITAAFTVGAMDRSLTRAAPGKLEAKHFTFVVLTCPWLIAASVIAIREIWVYCVFAVALFAGTAFRSWQGSRKILASAAVLAVLGPACFLLRSEMVGPWMLLFFLTVFDTKDSAERRFFSDYARIAVLALLALAAYNLVATENFQNGFIHRAEQYAANANDAGMAPGETGLVLSIARQGFFVRGIVETLWIWAFPLPKFAPLPGSLYSIALSVTPFWTLGCLLLVFARPRVVVATSEVEAEAIEAASVRRRFSSHLLWLAAFTVMVGFTSCETRHLYASVPLVCVLIANAARDRLDVRSLESAKSRAMVATFFALVGCVLLTLIVFGPIEL